MKIAVFIISKDWKAASAQLWFLDINSLNKLTDVQRGKNRNVIARLRGAVRSKDVLEKCFIRGTFISAWHLPKAKAGFSREKKLPKIDSRFAGVCFRQTFMLMLYYNHQLI